jgi:hypothetical protein
VFAAYQSAYLPAMLPISQNVDSGRVTSLQLAPHSTVSDLAHPRAELS